jgi:hypothetical protein
VNCYGRCVTPEAATEKRMRLRYAGTCRLCGRGLAAGEQAIYEREMRTVRCVVCAPVPTGEDGALVDAGDAGRSARREYERRRDRREERIRAAHPKLGGLILALSDDPQSTRAWQQGAVGEAMMAERLATLPVAFRTLHDRRIPGTRANIDHIAVGPSGVWIIDAKRYKGKRPQLRTEGGLIRPRVDSLRIGGRDGSTLVRGIESQIERVALFVEDVPVKGVLCFLEADWPLIGGSFTVDGIIVTWPRELIKRMSAADAHPGIDVEAVHSRLAQAFPVA